MDVLANGLVSFANSLREESARDAVPLCDEWMDYLKQMLQMLMASPPIIVTNADMVQYTRYIKWWDQQKSLLLQQRTPPPPPTPTTPEFNPDWGDAEDAIPGREGNLPN